MQIMLQTQLKKAFNKKDFNPGASTLKMACWYFTSLLFFRSGLMPSSTVLVLILKLFGAKIGKDVRIKPYVHIHYPWKLTIGSHVCISQQAMLLTGNHNYSKTSFDLITKPIVLADGVWIGAKAIVCPGVTAESHSVLSVGAVATKDLAAYAIYQGNPAVKVRDRVIAD
jgi:putative colanic acid biosynthesis acetyltransferase WcaF